MVNEKAKNVVLERLERTVENVSPNRLFVVFKPKTGNDQIVNAQPMNLREIVCNYHTKHDDNLHHINKYIEAPKSPIKQENVITYGTNNRRKHQQTARSDDKKSMIIDSQPPTDCSAQKETKTGRRTNIISQQRDYLR